MNDQTFTLITGASEGLGRAFALECAQRGYNLVLVALPGSGLHRLGQFIASEYDVQVRCIETDISEEDNCLDLVQQVKHSGADIRMLINNAGMGGTVYFDQCDPQYYSRQIRLNTLAPTLLTRLLLPDLLRLAPAYVLNVSSLAALFTLPQKQVYSGTKSYLLSFSKSLRQELKGKKVYVSALCPGAINTSWRLTVANQTTGTWLSQQSVLEPQVVARIALRGLLRNKACIIPGFLNRCFLHAGHLCPAWLQELLTELQMKQYRIQPAWAPIPPPQHKSLKAPVYETR